ncbi:SRPBCC family protein [Kribbella sp. NPDC050241]|uniref:SRPBCC family protein n=1 Tax=Kribbella sp. NPDC050241 TaxID=3364115 RepID=UPI0037A3346A
MSENKRVVRASAADVFAVLGDGWSYAGWVVGAARVRSVDQGFPEAGTSIHHSVGVWPLMVNDVTTVEEFEPDRRLVIKVRVWPAGAGRVEFVATIRPDGCLLVMREEAVERPANLVPSPVLDPLLHWRNTETLRRLAYLAESRAGLHQTHPAVANVQEGPQ